MRPVVAIGVGALVVVVLIAFGWARPARHETAAGSPPTEPATSSTPSAAASSSTTGPSSSVASTPPSVASNPITTIAATTVPATPEMVAAFAGNEALVPASWYRTLLAVSSEEIWAILSGDDAGPNVVGRLLDGEWTYYRTTEASWGTFGLAAAPDGTVWAVTQVGVFAFDGRTWTRRSPDPAPGVAVGEDGSVWIGGRREGIGGPADPRLWLGRWDGTAWQRVDSMPDAPWDGSAGTHIAVLSNGEVWIAHRPGSWVEDDLTRYDGVAMEVVTIPGVSDPTPENNMPAVRVFEIEAGRDGGLWAVGYHNAEPRRAVLARYDGAVWTLVDWPFSPPSEGPLEADLAVGPDGRVWAAFGDGLWSFDGSDWTGRLEGEEILEVDVAPDGAVWYADESGIHLLPDPD